MLPEDTNVSSSYIHLCYPKTLMSPTLMLLEDTNVSNSYIHLYYSKTLMSPAHIYQSRDIADQVSFIISVTRKILLSPTSKIKITHFSYSERSLTIIKILELD